MVENYVLRANARKQLGGNIFANKWLLCMVMFLIYEIISVVINFPSNLQQNVINSSESLTSPNLLLWSTVSSAVSLLTSGAFALGLINGCLKIVENDPSFSVFAVFSGFRRFWQAFLLNLMTALYIFLWTLLFIIPGFIKSYSYAMAPYFLRDRDEYEWRDALDASKDIMQGHKMQLFLLDVSFIGWYLLGLLCVGVGVLFVIPYHQVARANFYEALIAANDPANYAYFVEEDEAIYSKDEPKGAE